jgi:putative peptidoglycan lipid II flippase
MHSVRSGVSARQDGVTSAFSSHPQASLALKATWTRSALTTVATVIGQAPGFLVPLAVARVLGATSATDAFFFAFALVSFVLYALAGATQNAFVPVLVYLEQARARSVVAVVESVSLIVTTLAIFALVLASRLGHLASPAMLVALLPFALFAALASVWTGALYAARSYVVAAAAPAIRGLGVLLMLWVFRGSIGVNVLFWGYSLAELTRAALLWVYARPPRLTWRIPEGVSADVVSFLRGGGAQAAGSALVALMPVVDRSYAATLGSGSVSLIDYADRVCQAPVSLLMSGFLVVSLAQWSHDTAGGDSIAVLRTRVFWNSVLLFTVSIIPIGVLIAFRHGVTEMLFGRSHISPDDIGRLADTIGAFLLGIPILLAGLTYARAFLVLRRNDWLLKVSVAQLAAKIALSAVLLPRLGLPGLALATAVVYAFASLAHLVRLHTMTGTMDAR